MNLSKCNQQTTKNNKMGKWCRDYLIPHHSTHPVACCEKCHLIPGASSDLNILVKWRVGGKKLDFIKTNEVAMGETMMLFFSKCFWNISYYMHGISSCRYTKFVVSFLSHKSLKPSDVKLRTNSQPCRLAISSTSNDSSWNRNIHVHVHT